MKVPTSKLLLITIEQIAKIVFSIKTNLKCFDDDRVDSRKRLFYEKSYPIFFLQNQPFPETPETLFQLFIYSKSYALLAVLKTAYAALAS